MRAVNGILFCCLVPMVVGVSIGAVLRFIDLVGARRDSLVVDPIGEAASPGVGWPGFDGRVTNARSTRLFSALICTPQEALRRAGRFADQARETIDVDGLNQVIVETVGQ